MNQLFFIKKTVINELKEFNLFFDSFLKNSSSSLLNIISSYILKNKGKQIRPLLVFLSAKLFNNITPSTYYAASLIELMHTATLIHDDVVDNSYERRGMFSVNALWKNKVAVLLGDYFLAKGLILAVDKNEYKLLHIVSEAVREMSEGELLQIEKARKIDITEDLYYTIIYKKTASLISACTLAGAISANANQEDCIKLKELGKNIGMAFQIKDDLFDFNIHNKTGKPAGNDIREQKYTLPIIYTLKQSNSEDKKTLLKLLKTFEDNKENIYDINKLIEKYGGFTYTKHIMFNYINKAKEILSDLPQNEANNSLALLIDYLQNREN